MGRGVTETRRPSSRTPAPVREDEAMTGNPFYTERVYGAIARDAQVLSDSTKNGLLALVGTNLENNWFAAEFPERCPDTDQSHVFSTDVAAFGNRAEALIPGLVTPLSDNRYVASDDTIFDLLEFAGRYVAEPKEGARHAFYGHYELKFDRAAGAKRFRNDVNELLARGGAGFEMTKTMTINRLGTPEMRKALESLNPDTGDAELDKLINDGRRLIASRKSEDRLRGLQELWDAYERLKSIEDPRDGKKNNSAEQLLEKIAYKPFREVIRADMRVLTALGNKFRVRHHEAYISELPREAYDYFTGRLVNVLLVLLDHSDRLAD